MPSRLKHHPWGLVLATFILPLAAAGCRSLPETGVQSFAAATTTLTVSVTAMGNRAVQDVAEIHSGKDPSKAQAEALAQELKQEWAKRIKVMEGLSRYSASLAGLVESGKAGQENARAFVNSVSSLADAVGAAIPAAPAVTALLNLAERTYAEIAEHLAARHIAKAVEAADPVVVGLSGLIAEDLLNLRSIAVERRRTALTQLRAGSDLPAQLNSLTAARATLTSKALDPARPDAAALDQLAKVNAAYSGLANDPEYLNFHAREQEINRLFDAQADLLDQASATLGAWGTAHHDLVLAMRQKRTPSLDELNHFANDLYEIYKEYRKARRQP